MVLPYRSMTVSSQATTNGSPSKPSSCQTSRTGASATAVALRSDRANRYICIPWMMLMIPGTRNSDGRRSDRKSAPGCAVQFCWIVHTMIAPAMHVMTIPTIVVALNKRGTQIRFKDCPVSRRCSSLVSGVHFGYDRVSDAEDGGASGLLQNAQTVSVAPIGAPHCGQWRAWSCGASPSCVTVCACMGAEDDDERDA